MRKVTTSEMSTNADISVAKRIPSPSTLSVGDDTSIISVEAKTSQISTTVVRALLALVFVGLGVGAIVYSVTNSEKSQHGSNSPSNWLFYNPFISQSCEAGNLTIEVRLNISKNDDSSERVIIVYGSEWFQDDENKMLFHRVGLDVNDWQFSIFAYDSYLVLWTPHNCTKYYGRNYTTYIESFGTAHLRRGPRNEAVFIDGKYEPVILFRDEPSVNFTINGMHPTLVSAYVDPKTGATRGWEEFFGRSHANGLYRKEHWFPTMYLGSPDASLFYNYPSECERHIIDNEPATSPFPPSTVMPSSISLH